MLKIVFDSLNGNRRRPGTSRSLLPLPITRNKPNFKVKLIQYHARQFRHAQTGTVKQLKSRA